MRTLDIIKLVLSVGILAAVVSGMLYWIPKYVPEYMQSVVAHAFVVFMSLVSSTIVFIKSYVDGEWTVATTVASAFVALATTTAIVLISLKVAKDPTQEEQEEEDKWDNIYLSVLSTAILLAGVLEEAISETIEGFTGEFVVLMGEIMGGGRRKSR